MDFTRFLVLAFVLVLPSLAHAQDDGSEIHSAVARYVTYRDLGMTEQAQFTIERAAERFPDSAAVQLALAEAHHLDGNKAEAKAAYDRGLKLDPENAVAQANRAELLEGSPPIRAFNPPSREPLVPEDLIAAYDHLVKYVRSTDAELSRMLEEFEGEELRTWLGAGPGGIYEREEVVDKKFRHYVDQRMEELKEAITEFEISTDAWTEQSGAAQTEIKDAGDKMAHHEEWSDMEVSEEHLEQNRGRIEQLQQEMVDAEAEADQFQKAANAAVNGNSNRETIMLNVEAAEEAKSRYKRLNNEYERLLNPKKFELAREFAEENREKVWDLFEAEDNARVAWQEAKDHWNQLEEEHGSSSEEALAAQEVTNEKYWAWKEAEKAYRNATPSLDRRAEQQRRVHINGARDEHRRQRVAEEKLDDLDGDRERTTVSLRRAINWAYQSAIEGHWRSYSTLTSIRISLRIGIPYAEELRAIRADYDSRRDMLQDAKTAQEWTMDEFCMAMLGLYSDLRPAELQVHHHYRAKFHSLMRRYFLREQEMYEFTREFADSEDQDERRRGVAANISKNISNRTLGDARWGPTGFARMGMSELPWPSMCDSVGGIRGLEPETLDFRDDSLTNGVFEDYETLSGDSLEEQLTQIVRKRWESMQEWEKNAVVKTIVKSREGTKTLVDAMRGHAESGADLGTTFSEMIVAMDQLNESTRTANEFLPGDDETQSVIDKAFRLINKPIADELISRLVRNNEMGEMAHEVTKFIENSYEAVQLVQNAAEGRLEMDDVTFLMNKAKHPLKNTSSPAYLIVNVTNHSAEAMKSAAGIVANMENVTQAQTDELRDRFTPLAFFAGAINQSPESLQENGGVAKALFKSAYGAAAEATLAVFDWIFPDDDD